LRYANVQNAQLARYKAGDRNFNAVDLEKYADYIKYENGEVNFKTWQAVYYDVYSTAVELEASKNMNKKAVFYPYATPTMELRWSNLVDLENLAFIRIIMGQEPLDYFDTFVKQWNDQGGTRIAEEVTAQWKTQQ
jgi:putative aldouronate transport system substrate-binding protein